MTTYYYIAPSGIRVSTCKSYSYLGGNDYPSDFYAALWGHINWTRKIFVPTKAKRLQKAIRKVQDRLHSPRVCLSSDPGCPTRL